MAMDTWAWGGRETLPIWVAAITLWGILSMFVFFRVARCLPGPWPHPGIARILALAPFLLPFMLMSAILPSANARVALNFTWCWVTPAKLLLLSAAPAGSGIYTYMLDCPSWSLSRFSHFLLAFLLPVRIKGSSGSAASAGSSSQNRHLRCLLVVELVGLLSYLSVYDYLPVALQHVAHCISLYLILVVPHRVAALALSTMYGVDVLPAFNKPWLSPSLSDFWGNRWDLTANALLRKSVYNPVLNYLLGSKPAVTPPRVAVPLAVRLVAVNTTFLISGLIHELLYFSVTQAAEPTWEVTAFFVVHGLATSAEIVMRRLCPKHFVFRVSQAAKVACTLSFVYVTAIYLFFPQLVRAGIFVQCSSEHRAVRQIIFRAALKSHRAADLTFQTPSLTLN